MWPFPRRSRFRQVDDGFSVTGAIRPEDLPAIAKAGFRELICTRPDGEEPGQTDFATIAAEAEHLGLTAHHIPVSGMPGPDQVTAFRAVMAVAEGPVLGWCRSGARAETLRRMAKG